MTNKIKESNITDGAVTSDKLTDGAVTSDKLDANAVTSAKLNYPLTTFSSTGIDDNASGNAITIESSKRVQFTRPRSNTLGDSALEILPSDTVAGIGFRMENTNNDLVIEKSSPSGSEAEILRIRIGGGIAIGGTGDANTLDDYEEGSFTAELSSTGATFTYTVRQGWYVKVGNRVMFNIYIQLDGTPFTTTSNDTRITGLPFISGNLSGNENRMICGTRLVNFSSGQTFLMGNIGTNSNTVYLIQGGDNSVGIPLPSNALSNASGQIFLSGSYQTA